MLKWLDSISPWWYTAGAVFVLSIIWLIYEIHRAPIPKKCKQEHTPVNASIGFRKSSCDCNNLNAEQLTIEIYHLSHQLDELLAHEQYEEARLIADQLDATLNQFIIKQTETVTKA